MTPTPRFRSHAEQQATLGCAGQLNPKKHPRRYAQQQEREKLKPHKHIRQPGSERRTPELVAQARKLSHLHMAEVARLMNVSRSVLTRLRDDYGLTFAEAVRPSHADRVRAAAPLVGTMRELAEATDLKYLQVYNLCKKHGITLGGANGQTPKGS